MKHKVSEIEGVLLDAAVCMAEGREHVLETLPSGWRVLSARVVLTSAALPELSKSAMLMYKPSQEWKHGGPIIELERIELGSPGSHRHRGQWAAWTCVDVHEFYGATPLIAAMRAFVASKLGEEVDLP